MVCVYVCVCASLSVGCVDMCINIRVQLLSYDRGVCVQSVFLSFLTGEYKEPHHPDEYIFEYGVVVKGNGDHPDVS